MVRNIFTFVFVIAAASGVLASPVKRCPPGLNCGVGPECTIYDCDIENCASAPICQKRGLEHVADKVKRDPTPVNHPCPQICNEEGVCGCALESAIASAMA